MLTGWLLLALQLMTMATLAAIALSDLRYRYVSHRLLFALLIPIVMTTPFNVVGALISAVILGFGVLALHYRWLGAADSKLLALCAYGAAEQWGELLLQTALFGGVLSVLCLVHNHFAHRGWIAQKSVKTVPYAIAISGASLTTLHYL